MRFSRYASRRSSPVRTVSDGVGRWGRGMLGRGMLGGGMLGCSLFWSLACGSTDGGSPGAMPGEPTQPSALPAASASSEPSSSNGPAPVGTPSAGVPTAEPSTPSLTDPGTAGTVPIQHDPKRVLSRLTRVQFANSVAALLGTESLDGVLASLPDPVPNGGFGNSGYAQAQPYDVVVAYDAASRRIVSNLSDWSRVHARYGGCTEHACITDFVASFARAAFRRPVTEAEVNALLPITVAAREDGLSYAEATAHVVRAVLQSPEFLYLFEDEVLTDHQLATRLAYFVTDGPPDETLLAAAQAGTLRTTAELSGQVERLLASTGDRFGRAFARDLLGLRRIHQRVVDIDPGVREALAESAADSFARLVATDGEVSALFTATEFVANAETARFLAGDSGTAGVFTSTPAHPLLGLLTHPAVLIAISNAVEGSMVSRGQFIAHQLLCIPPTPPPAAAFLAEDVGELPPDATQRDEAEARLAERRCAGCHIQFEPYAFGLNKWGGDGRFHDDPRLDDGGPIVTSLGTFEFSSYETFFPQLAASAQYRRCISDHFIRYALRHTSYPPELVDQVIAQAQGSGGDARLGFRALARAVVLQPAFATR